MRHTATGPKKNTAPRSDGRKVNATATQAVLRAVGHKLFGQLGYEGTSLGAICSEAGVTTGALYHHFGDKKGVFAAVAEELDAGLVALTATARARWRMVLILGRHFLPPLMCSCRLG